MRGKGITLLCLLVASALLAGCRDAPVEPSALLVTVETHPALSVHGELPSLPALVERYGLESGLREAVAAWWEGWGAVGEEAQGLREVAYAAVSPALAAAMPGPAVDSLLAAMERWVLIVAGLGDGALPGAIAEAVAGAAAEVAAGRRALAEGGTARAVGAVLRASDDLRGVSAPVVAELLVRDALERLAREDSAAPSLEVRRARRLVQGAQQALDAGDHDRAIRRAYYAKRLLEARAEGREGPPEDGP